MSKGLADKVVKDIRRAMRRRFSAEEKIRIALAGLRGEESIAELCRVAGPVLLAALRRLASICFSGLRRSVMRFPFA
jgi:hypothetical protein